MKTLLIMLSWIAITLKFDFPNNILTKITSSNNIYSNWIPILQL